MKSKSDIKIAILIVYFGKFPWYFNYFINSCNYNPSVYFIIITDNLLSNDYYIPVNVKIIPKSLNELKQEACKKLGFSVEIENPYKLCDFKPAYGLIFSELIENYDFWGHGDIDVIFGNIRKFITDKVLKEHDLICVRHDFLTGYFLLFRNNDLINNLFKFSKDYKKVFTTAKHFCFDETNFAFDQFADGIYYNLVESEIESMTHVVKKLHEKGIINAYFDFHVIEGRPGRLMWKKGNLFYKKKYEILLYHLIRLKYVYYPIKITNHIPNIYFISPTRIYTRSPKQNTS